MELFFKNFYRNRKHHISIIVTNAMAIFLVFITTVFSDYLTQSVDKSITDIGADISMLILPDLQYDDFLKDNQITDYLLVKEKQYGDYSLVCLDGKLSLLPLDYQHGRGLQQLDLLSGTLVCVVGDSVNYQNNKVNINGVNFKVIGVSKQESDNIYFDLAKTIFIPINYQLEGMDSKLLFKSDKSVERYLENKYEDNYTLLDQSTVKQSFELITKAASIVMMFMAIFSMVISLIGMLNMTLVQLSSRKKEIAIKKSLSATDKDIVKEMLGETVIVMLLSILLAWLVARWVIMGINAIIMGEISINYQKVGKNTLIILLFGVLWGLLPAYKASKITVIQAMKNPD